MDQLIKLFLSLLFPAVVFAGEPPLHVYSATSKLPWIMQYVDNTVAAIAKSIYPRKIEYRNVSINELLKIAAAQKADIIIAGAGFTVRRKASGYRDIGSAVTREQKDINQANGSTVIALRGRNDINKLADLKGKTILANDPEGFQGIIILLYELQKQGFDPDKFFKEIKYIGNDFRPYLKDLKEGRFDAMVLPSCHFELIGRAGDDTSYLKVVGEKKQDKVQCAVSTELFPNWSIIISPMLDFDTQHAILRGINSLTRERDGIAWGYAADDAPVIRMYRELKRGPYEYLRHWSFSRIWKEYRTVLIFFIVLVLGFVFHYFRIRMLVARRTLQLQNSLIQQKELSKRNLKLQKENQQMQNAAAVSHFSSIVAHELSQPLSGIILYANSLKTLLSRKKKPGEEEVLAQTIIDKLLNRAMKSAQVVDEVRSFSKNSTRDKEAVDIVAIVQKTVEEFKETEQVKNNVVTFESETDKAVVYGVAFDLKLIVMNLLRNAIQATRGCREPKILIRYSQFSETWCEISVEDNGPCVDQVIVERLGKPVESLKDDGLGLGLSIVKYIVENHQGKIHFSISKKLKGLKVTISLRKIVKQKKPLS